MDAVKLALSEEELRLVTDPGIILTKNAIIRKVYNLFGELSERMQNDLILPAEVAVIPPKISKGEAYQELPYVMLDHPRYFHAQHVLAIRTFFWWGHFFSVTLHLKGRYAELYRRTLIKHFDILAGNGYRICVSDDEWQHDLDSDAYTALAGLGSQEFESLLEVCPFVKIGRKFSLEQWQEMLQLLRGTQQELGKLIGLSGC